MECPAARVVRREYDAYVAATCRDAPLNLLLVSRRIVAGRAVPHEQVLVHAEETVTLEGILKRPPGLPAHLAVTRETGNYIYPHKPCHERVGKTMTLPVPSYTPASVEADKSSASAGISS